MQSHPRRQRRFEALVGKGLSHGESVQSPCLLLSATRVLAGKAVADNRASCAAANSCGEYVVLCRPCIVVVGVAHKGVALRALLVAVARPAAELAACPTLILRGVGFLLIAPLLAFFRPLLSLSLSFVRLRNLLLRFAFNGRVCWRSETGSWACR